jgi:hypothetical protein
MLSFSQHALPAASIRAPFMIPMVCNR